MNKHANQAINAAHAIATSKRPGGAVTKKSKNRLTDRLTKSTVSSRSQRQSYVS